MKNLPIEKIRALLSENDNLILNLYLQRKKQKEICELTKCSRGHLDALVKKFKLTRFRDRKLYCCNDAFLTLNNPKIWYFLGLFASDGNMYRTNNIERVQFTMKDRDAVESIVDILGYTGPIQECIKNNRLYYQVMISYPPLNTLIKKVFGDVYRKTDSIKFPSIHKKHDLQLFLRGYIDGDGSFCKTKVASRFHFSIYCKSNSFVQSFFKVLQFITNSHVALYKGHYLELCSSKANTLLYQFLYNNNLEIGIKRKQIRALQHIARYKN